MSDYDTTPQFIHLGGLKIAYWESNAHATHTLVLLHGFRSSHQGLMKLAQGFPDHHLIIPDFPGYGQTDELDGEHNVETYANVIGGLVAALDLRDITIMGHSFGALVGLAYTAAHPGRVRNLVLISPVPKFNLMNKAGSLYYLIGRALPAPLDRQWLTSRALQRPMRNFVMRTNDPVLHSEVMSEGERELKNLRTNVNLENYFSLATVDPTVWLDSLQVPALVVAGDSDRLTRLSDVIHTYQCPAVSFSVIEGMGHFAPAEIPAEISHRVQTWLSEKDASASPRHTKAKQL